MGKDEVYYYNKVRGKRADNQLNKLQQQKYYSVAIVKEQARQAECRFLSFVSHKIQHNVPPLVCGNNKA